MLNAYQWRLKCKNKYRLKVASFFGHPVFDLIPGMTVIFSDGDFTTTAHSEAAYQA